MSNQLTLTFTLVHYNDACLFSISVYFTTAIGRHNSSEMKTILNLLTVVCFIAKTIIAGEIEIKRGLKLLGSSSGGGTGPEDVFSYFEQINGYGCWCYFGSESLRGNGDVQDDIDGLCRQLVYGYGDI